MSAEKFFTLTTSQNLTKYLKKKEIPCLVYEFFIIPLYNIFGLLFKAFGIYPYGSLDLVFENIKVITSEMIFLDFFRSLQAKILSMQAVVFERQFLQPNVPYCSVEAN